MKLPPHQGLVGRVPANPARSYELGDGHDDLLVGDQTMGLPRQEPYMPLIPYPQNRQATSFDCGAAALQGLLYCYGIEVEEPDLFGSHVL